MLLLRTSVVWIFLVLGDLDSLLMVVPRNSQLSVSTGQEQRRRDCFNCALFLVLHFDPRELPPNVPCYPT